MQHVTLYSDGSARKNPSGPGGYGTILEVQDASGRTRRLELSQGFRQTTNNRMELMGAIAGLEALRVPCQVEVWSDSQYLVHAFTHGWIAGWIKKGWMRTKSEPVKNVDLWKRLLAASAPHEVSWNWVRGHNGHPQNERCDLLATSAADSGNLVEDPGFSKA